MLGFNSLGGSRILTYHMDHQATRRDLGCPGRYSVDLLIDPLILGPDLYDLDLGSRSGDFHILDTLRGCAQVEVIAGPNTPSLMFQKSPGVRLEGTWSWGPVSLDNASSFGS